MNATTAKSHLRGLLQRTGSCLIFILFAIAEGYANPRQPQTNVPPPLAQEAAKNPHDEQQNPRPYMDEPLKQLLKRVPELKGVRPAANQEELPLILQRAGEQVEEFFGSAVDLIAREEIKQERKTTFGIAGGREPIRDNYLIVRHGKGTDADFEEFRMDEQGHRMDALGLRTGFLVTTGFALMSADFSPGFQVDSKFRHIGDQKVAGRDTYVVAFAQQSGEPALTVTMMGPNGKVVHLMRQGIAWVDKENFHIVQMRTDLLTRQPEIGLDEQTTKVKFSEVRLSDVAVPLWLPLEVNVYMKVRQFSGRQFEEEFRNVHRYTDYRRYHVSTKMLGPE